MHISVIGSAMKNQHKNNSNKPQSVFIENVEAYGWIQQLTEQFFLPYAMRMRIVIFAIEKLIDISIQNSNFVGWIEWFEVR